MAFLDDSMTTNVPMPATYLDKCLKSQRTVRWPDKAIPIKVYIAPFQWYEESKRLQADGYRKMVLDALRLWSDASGALVRFQVVSMLNQSQIDVDWRRVDRTSLGHCEYLVNKASALYSAEIKIGISDGLIHAKYNDTREVKHTIMHELGHALGLIGHSDSPEDIMYVPHQYGITRISERDIETLRWLYKLPVGFDYIETGQRYQLSEPFSLQDVMDNMSGITSKTGSKNTLRPLLKTERLRYPENPEKLHEHHQILSDMGKFYIQTQPTKRAKPDSKTRRHMLKKKPEQPNAE